MPYIDGEVALVDDAAMLEGRLPDRGVSTSVPILLATSWA